MNADAASTTEILYKTVLRYLIDGWTDEEIITGLSSHDVPRNIAEIIIETAMKNIRGCVNKRDLEEIRKTIVSSSHDHVAFITLRNTAYAGTKNEVMSGLNVRCVVFCDEERIKITYDEAGREGIYGREQAWQRTYDVDGTDAGLKLSSFEKLAKTEYDGIDYLRIMVAIPACTMCLVASPDGKATLIIMNENAEQTFYDEDIKRGFSIGKYIEVIHKTE